MITVMFEFTRKESNRWLDDVVIRRLTDHMHTTLEIQKTPKEKREIVRGTMLCYAFFLRLLFECEVPDWSKGRTCKTYPIPRLRLKRNDCVYTVDLRFSRNRTHRFLIVPKRYCTSKRGGDIQVAFRFGGKCEDTDLGAIDIAGWTLKSELLQQADEVRARYRKSAQAIEWHRGGKKNSTVMMLYDDLYPIDTLMPELKESMRVIDKTGRRINEHKQGKLF